MEKPDWDIDYLSNNAVCAKCGKKETRFPKYICDAHTHGMERYGHLNFQVVLDYGMQEVAYLLNAICQRVHNGERFKDKDLVAGLYLDCDIQLRQVTDCDGQPILRLIIPDRQNRLPEESEPPYTYQTLATSILHLGKTSQ